MINTILNYRLQFLLVFIVCLIIPATIKSNVVEDMDRDLEEWNLNLLKQVQNTPGAEILIHFEGPAEGVQTGANPKFDSYSGFVDDGGNQTGLDGLLRRDGIKKLIIYGLATDYCVKHTALDAAELGYQVELRIDLCRGISPETTASALEEMKAKGVTILR